MLWVIAILALVPPMIFTLACKRLPIATRKIQWVLTMAWVGAVMPSFSDVLQGRSPFYPFGLANLLFAGITAIVAWFFWPLYGPYLDGSNQGSA